MAAYEKLAGKVDWVRLGGSKVRAGGKLCFAIERDRNMSALPTSKGGMVFSDAGAGLKPIAIIAESEQDLKMAMRASTGYFYIDDNSSMMAKEMQGAYTIYAKVAPMREMKSIEIHDATSVIIKNVFGFATGFLSAGHDAVEYVSGLVGNVLDAKSAAVDAKSIGKSTSDAFGEKGKVSGLVACVIHIYPSAGSYKTNRSTISVQELATIVFSNSSNTRGIISNTR